MSPAPVRRSGMDRAAAVAFVAWAMASGLAFALERATAAAMPSSLSGDPFKRLVGSISEAVGDTIFIKADSYYHGGIDEHIGEESEEERLREGHIGDAPATGDWIAWVNGRVREHSHHHLTQDKQKEMLPLFSLALRLDPHNVPAVLTTAYWLERQLAKPAEARRVLEKGAADNPDAWEIDYRTADLIRRRFRDYATARAWYERALVKMTSRSDVEHYLLRNAYYSLGECLENLNDPAGARRAYENALHYFKSGDPEGFKEAVDVKLRRSLPARQAGS